MACLPYGQNARVLHARIGVRHAFPGQVRSQLFARISDRVAFHVALFRIGGVLMCPIVVMVRVGGLGGPRSGLVPGFPLIGPVRASRLGRRGRWVGLSPCGLAMVAGGTRWVHSGGLSNTTCAGLGVGRWLANLTPTMLGGHGATMPCLSVTPSGRMQLTPAMPAVRGSHRSLA